MSQEVASFSHSVSLAHDKCQRTMSTVKSGGVSSCVLVLSQRSLPLHGPGPKVRHGAATFSLDLLESVKAIETVSHRHAHGLT